MPAGAFGAVRPVGAILPTATAAGPFSRAADGYAAPKAPAGQSCSDDVFPANTDDWSFPLTPYRSEGPCRHNMSYIFMISKVVFEGTRI